jgi:hypothetical protein
MILIFPHHCLIYDPDFSPSLSYIWSWFFPVTVLYMILIFPHHCLIYDPDFSHHCLIYDPDFPCHCLIYDPDFSPSLSYIWSRFLPITVLYMILIFPHHCLIYDPDFSPSLSYIWSWFFPVTVLYMILIPPRHCLIYDPEDSDGEESWSYIRQWWGKIRIIYKTVMGKNQDHI